MFIEPQPIQPEPAVAPIRIAAAYEQENGYAAEQPAVAKNRLRLVMNPSGQVHDIHSLQNHGFESTENNRGMLSPNKCAELVNALTCPDEPQGKGNNDVLWCVNNIYLIHIYLAYQGAELFAKRRKRSEKWIVDGTNNNANEFELNNQVEENAHVSAVYCIRPQ